MSEESSVELPFDIDNAPPPLAVGHVKWEVGRVPETIDMLEKLGVRSIVKKDHFAVLELAGGTHIVLRQADGPTRDPSFDLIVKDLPRWHQLAEELGYETTSLEEGRIHDSFKVRSPDGAWLEINSSHAGDRPI